MQKILIVDDSELNREILAAMLETEYKIDMAKDGAEAVTILEKNWENYQIVLLDLNMPVLNGYEVLKIMKEKQWLDSLPVICISAETSEESIGRAYELGAADYFTRPFDTAVVLRRVHNTIALYTKASTGLHDAMEMLSNIFYRIMKINLTKDTYKMLKNITDDLRSPLDNIKSISERLTEYGEEYVHTEDKEAFLEFCDRTNMREKFADGETERLSISYRCRSGQEFRWVSMEVIKSTEYVAGNEVVLLYIRDINADYLKQLDMVLSRSKDSVGMVNINVTSGTCVSGSSSLKKLELLESDHTLDQYIKRISVSIPQEIERNSFIQKFSRQHMLASFEKGHTIIQEEYPVYSGDSQRPQLFRVTAELVRNSFSNQIEAILYFTNITEKYLAEKMPQILYQKSYEEIAVIDLKRRKIAVSSAKSFDFSQSLDHELDYDRYLEEVIQKFVPEEEKLLFQNYAELANIKRELDQKGRYSFSAHQFNKNGEKCLINYTYLYFNQYFGVVVVAIEDITELSGQDALTGGYNRQGFVQKAERVLQNSEETDHYAILFFNIKNFKAVNELFGIDLGDFILREIYDDLKNSLLQPIIIARAEADHFVCLVKRETLDSDVLTRLCTKKISRSGKTIRLFSRCGIFYIEDKTMPVNMMIGRAKLAKKYITDEYVQPYKVYDSSMQTAYIDKAEIAGELAEGIAKGELQVYYQPVVNAETGKIASAEALIRWKHSEKGFLSPGFFIPALEESGHISELDDYVINQVNNFLMDRYHAGKRVVPVSVNLSWMDFYDEKIMEDILDKCKNNNLPEKLIRLEVTETSYAAMGESRNSILESFRTEGVKIMMDDFGSGYSSFGMLQQYNFDIMKIDMSFIRQIETNPKTKSILRFLIDMAHEMEIRIVAEGVETEVQAEFLKKCHCDYIQGYYYYRPIPQEEFRKLLDEM